MVIPAARPRERRTRAATTVRGGPVRAGTLGTPPPEGSVGYLVKEDPEEGRSLIVRVCLELRIDVDDESRGHGGEQTGLLSE